MGHNHTFHSPLDHPCAASGLYATLLATGALCFLVLTGGMLCARFGARRLRARRQELSEARAREKYGHFWFTRLEAAGLVLLLVSPLSEFIAYARNKEVASMYWILSTCADLLGMTGVYFAFIWEDTSFEIPFGLTGSALLLLSDIFGAYSAALLGISSSDTLGVVVLWFASSCISMAGCIALALCYFTYPCGDRLGMYFEALCLILFIWAGMLEIAWGFCPFEANSPNFFGAAGLLNMIGYSLCLAALSSEDWGLQGLRWRTRFNESSDEEVDEDGPLLSSKPASIKSF